jgi:hypothetical protein
MRALIFVVAALASLPIVAQAQVKPEIRPFVGAYIPTGSQRDILKDAFMGGGQLALEVNNQFHVVGSFAYSAPHFKGQVSDHAHLYQSDIGAELFRDMSMQNDWKFRPFVGAGLGVRTFDPAGPIGAKNYPSGYAALGAEFQLAQLALRLETRDYLMSFKGVTGTDNTSTRNEIALCAGLAYHLR